MATVDRSKFARNIRWVLVALAGAALLGIAVVVLLSMRVQLPGDATVANGTRRNTSFYLQMHDGTEIAVDLWLPPELTVGQRVPVLIRATRYWRAVQYGWAYKPMLVLGALQPPPFSASPVNYFNRRGYAVLLVDARGSGASGGSRATEAAPDEIADYGEVARWASQQPWSNGRVGTFGISYDGDTAELAGVPNEPSLKAVAPLFNDFDSVMLVLPNGVYTRGFLQPWSDRVGELDRNDICSLQKVTGVKCWWLKQVNPGVKRVDADRDGDHLRTLVANRRNPVVAEIIGKVEFRDDMIGELNKRPLRLQDISPYGFRKELESSGVAMHVWCGWLDAATCEGTLQRFTTFSNPQQVIIGPCSHGCRFIVDPFLPSEMHKSPDPPLQEQWQMRANFFDLLLKDDKAINIKSGIRYYTMGEGQWHYTTFWPPKEFVNSTRRYYLADSHSLRLNPPESASASDSYTVDFTATTGQNSRWHTQMTGGDVVYPDRRDEDKKLLVYSSGPLETDVEITGAPVITLQFASTTSDGAVHVYLEDVAPDGRVTYLDEGMFRVVNRKIADPKEMPVHVIGPAHSLLRADSKPLVPGESAEISFALFPTSLLLRKGHSIRIALAGADAPMFLRYPTDTSTPTWTVYREKTRTSFIDIPLRPR
jgi:uncharacterized protein